MRYLHWRDDFSVTERFYSNEGGTRTAVSVPQRVEIEYFTFKGHGRFVASRNGNTFKNCSLSADGKSLTVNISLRNNPIGHGRLLRITTVITEDANFPEGLRYSRVPGQLDAVLYFGKSDGPLDIASEIVFDGVDRLSLLQDVSLSGLTPGDLFFWNGHSWTNIPQSAVSPDLSGYARIEDLPASLSSPFALSFGNKTYDGSTAVTLTAADLGALTEHQDLSDYALAADLTSLSARVTSLENNQFFELDANGNVTLKSQYQNLWVPGWLSAGGIGSGGSGGGGLISTVYTWSELQAMSVAPTDDTDSAFNAKSGYEIYQLVKAMESSTPNVSLVNGSNYSTLTVNGSVSDFYTKTQVDAMVSAAYRPAGNAASVAALGSLTSANIGKVYNMTASFTTTSDFVEGSGLTYPAGTNVVIVDAGSGTYKYDVLSGFVDLSGYAQKVSNATNGNFASLDANGNLVDSGHKHSDYALATDLSGYVTLTTPQDISGEKTFTSGIVTIKSSGVPTLLFDKSNNGLKWLITNDAGFLRFTRKNTAQSTDTEIINISAAAINPSGTTDANGVSNVTCGRSLHRWGKVWSADADFSGDTILSGNVAQATSNPAWSISSAGAAEFTTGYFTGNISTEGGLAVGGNGAFDGNVDINGDLTIDSTSHIKIGDAYIAWDNVNKALHVYGTYSGNDTLNIGFYCDGWVSAGGVGSGGSGSVSYLSDLEDVANGTPSNGDLLVYDTSVNNGTWVYKAQSQIVPSVTDYGATLTAGSTVTIASVGGTNITAVVPSFLTSFTETDPVFTAWKNGSQAKNKVWAAPSNASGAPGFRVLVAADIPTITKSKISDFPTTWAWSSITGTPTTLSGYGITDAVPSSRKVNGHELSSDVTVTKGDVGLGNVENTALSTWTGSSNITTLGTISTGTWNASVIGVTKGGTGLNSITTGAMLYASASNTIAVLAANGTRTNKFLTQTGTSAPAWATIAVDDVPDLSSLYLSLANGGTVIGNVSFSGNITVDGNGYFDGTLTSNGVLYAYDDIEASANLVMGNSSKIDIGPARVEYKSSSSSLNITTNVTSGTIPTIGLTVRNIAITDDINVGGDLTVEGESYFNDAIYGRSQSWFIDDGGSAEFYTLDVNDAAYFASSVKIGDAYLVYDANNHALRVYGTYPSGNDTLNIGFYCDGWVSAGGVSSGGGSSSVTYLSDLEDVEYGNPSNGDLLVYNSTSGEWEYTSQSGIVPSVTNFGATLTAGQTVTLASVGGTNITAVVPSFITSSDLSSWTGSSSITTVGTISSGTWSGTAIGVTKGGTGLTSISKGQLLYGGSTSNTISKLNANTSSTKKFLSETSSVPSWTTISSSDISDWSTALGTALGSYLPLTGGTLTGALTITPSTSSLTTSDGLDLGTVAHLASSTSGNTGLYTTGTIYLRPGNGSMSTSYGIVLGYDTLTYNGNTVYHAGNLSLSDYVSVAGNNQEVTGTKIFSSGQLIVKTGQSGTPTIELRRGTTSDNYVDWKIQGGVVDSAGSLIFIRSVGGTDAQHIALNNTSLFPIATVTSGISSLSLGSSSYQWANVYSATGTFSSGVTIGGVSVTPSNYVTLDGTQTISGVKTFSSNIKMANTTVGFYDSTGATSYASIQAASGYAQMNVGTSAYMFYSSSGFFFNGGGVECGKSDHRWSNVYSVAANLSGALTAASASLSGSLTAGSIVIGSATISYDFTNHALQVSGTDNGTTVGFYCDGYVSAGGIGTGGSGSGSTVTWGTTSNNQSPLTVDGTSKTLLLSSALVTSLSSSSTDYQVPSAKCVYDTVGDIETLINAL